MDRASSKTPVTQAEVSKLTTASFLESTGKSNSRMMEQLMDSDSAQEAFSIMQSAGYTGSLDIFKADVQRIQFAAKGKTLDFGSIVSQIAYCNGACGGDDSWGMTFI